MTSDLPDDEPRERTRGQSGPTKLGWCLTGHHEGRIGLPKGTALCPGVSPGGRPCPCYCHTKSRRTPSTEESR
jgi:hypothetical protein